MTSLGKVLVYINSAVAVALFSWAVSLYSNRVDWFDRTPEDGPKVEGQITQLQAEVKRYSDMIRSSQQAYAQAAERAMREEALRDFRQYVFFNEDTTRGGVLGWLPLVKNVDDTVRFREPLRLEKSSLLNVNQTGADVAGLDGKPLRGLGILNKLFDDLTNETMTRQQSILKLRAEYAALCDQVDAVQAEVLRQKTILENLTDEQEFLADAIINWEEQLRVLEIRRAQLQARLEAIGGR